MSFLIAHFYDRCMASTEDACLAQWRKELLSQVNGHVLEVGSGTGVNIDFYPEQGIQLVMSEPDNNMRKKLLAKVATKINQRNITVIDEAAEHMSATDNTYDYVVCTLVCCSVGHLQTALEEIHRVLKPGGRFVFLEHVLAQPSSRKYYWQNVVTPLWRKLAGNCHLNRDTEAEIIATGFELDDINRQDMITAFPLVKPTIRGVAIKLCKVGG